jgi:hypothetical protein
VAFDGGETADDDADEGGTTARVALIAEAFSFFVSRTAAVALSEEAFGAVRFAGTLALGAWTATRLTIAATTCSAATKLLGRIAETTSAGST